MANAIAIDGFFDLARELEAAAATAANSEAQRKSLSAGAEIIATEAQRIINQKTRRRSGQLSVGVAYELVVDAAYIGWAPDAFYGRFMETGTKKMSARPHIRPAYESKKEQAARAMIDVLRKGMEV